MLELRTSSDEVKMNFDHCEVLPCSPQKVQHKCLMGLHCRIEMHEKKDFSVVFECMLRHERENIHVMEIIHH